MAKQSITLTNLLTNPSFENTGWAANSACSIAYATSPKRSLTYSLKVTSTSSNESLIVTSDTYTIRKDHIYYVSVYFYETSNVCNHMQCYWPIAEPLIGYAYVDSSKLNQWQRLSWRNVRSNWTDGTKAQFRFDFEGMAANTVAYIDDAMLIDLTAAFGAGNEPAQEWCDANIDYFTSTKTIQYEMPNKYDLTITTPNKLQANDILNCPYTGSVKSITLPKGIYTLECWGAQGGNGNGSTSYPGGKGGYSKGTITLNKKTNLYLYAGGQGLAGTTYNSSGATTTGGFNGGGSATSINSRGSGGGGTDIRIGTDSLYARVLVAGGGSGSSGFMSSAGFAGGGVSGKTYNNADSTAGSNYYGGGGGQTSGGAACTSYSNASAGSFGQGGYYNSGSNTYYGSGGGGGWYGGGGSIGVGGGGSGYMYTASSASYYPSGCLLNSQYYLENATTLAGNTVFTSPTGTSETGHTGNGYVRITVIKAQGGNTLIKIPSELPSAYSQLEYLQFTGSQYINTGVVVNGNTGFDITFEPLNGQSSSPYYNLFGVRGNDSSGGTSENQNFFRIDTIPVDSNTGTEFKYGSTVYNSGIKDTSKINIKLINKVYTKPDGSTITVSGDITSGLAMYIGCINKENAAYGNFASMRIYRFKIYSGSTLTNDYIPALRISDNVSGLYDIKTNTFKINMTSGDFTKGDVINPWKNTKQIFVNTGSSSSIPSGLAELDYIENTGTSYIDTGINPDSLTKTVITFQMTANDGTHQVIFGSRASSSSLQYVLGFAGHQNPALWRSDYGNNQATFTSSLGYSTKYTCTKNGKTCTLGSETNTHTAVTFSSSYPMYLFACNTANAVSNNAKAKIYSCQIYDAGTLVRDFIPAKRTSDGKCGLWDKVNYKFYTDENGSNFTAGTEKSAIASPGTAIEYIEATGTQYINTNIKATQDYKLKVKYQTTQTSAGGIATSDTAWGNTGFGVWVNAGEYGNNNNSSLVLYGSTPNEVTFDKNGLILNGTNIWTPTSSTFTVTSSMTIFALNRNNSIQEYLTGKIYYVKIYDSDTLVRDFIPIKTTTNIYGLWDKVNKVFYPNAGTGTFTAGPTTTLSGWHEAKGVWVKTASDAWTQVL